MDVEQYEGWLVITAGLAYFAVDIYLGIRLAKRLQQTSELENKVLASPWPLGPVGLCVKINEIWMRTRGHPFF